MTTRNDVFKPMLYFYQVFVLKVIDGDTIIADIDMGFHTTLRHQRIRLYGINAPEKKYPDEWESARHKLVEMCYLGGMKAALPLYIKTRKNRRGMEQKGKYGRWLAELYDSEGKNLNALLLNGGWVKTWRNEVLSSNVKRIEYRQ